MGVYSIDHWAPVMYNEFTPHDTYFILGLIQIVRTLKNADFLLLTVIYTPVS